MSVKNLQTTTGISASVDYIEPWLDKLKELQGLIEKMDLIQNSTDGEKKSEIIVSAIQVLECRENSHQISITYHLIREILDYTFRDENVTANLVSYSAKLYEPNCIDKQELDKLVNSITNNKMSYVAPDKFLWTGEMTNSEKEDLLKLSPHPYWYRVVYDIHNNCGTTMSKTAERKKQLENFLMRESQKLDIYVSQIPSLISEFEKVRGKVNGPTHEPVKFFRLGKTVNSPNPKLDKNLQSQYDNFSQCLDDVLDFYGIFKFKPIGKLSLIDEIINE
jgi:hypothetical protein